MLNLQLFLLLFLASLSSSASVRYWTENGTTDVDCWPICHKDTIWSSGKLVPPLYSELSYRQHKVPAVAVVARNDAWKSDVSTFLLIVIVIILFSVAMRHLNDFFNGNTITLVKEGTWVHRFRHSDDISPSYLSRLDARYDEMCAEMSENEERMRLRSGRPLEDGLVVNVDTDD